MRIIQTIKNMYARDRQKPVVLHNIYSVPTILSLFSGLTSPPSCRRGGGCIHDDQRGLSRNQISMSQVRPRTYTNDRSTQGERTHDLFRLWYRDQYRYR